jgi:hypothetical protein
MSARVYGLFPRVVLPKKFGSVDYEREQVVLVFHGSLDELFAGTQQPARQHSAALVWRRGGRVWAGRGQTAVEKSELVLLRRPKGDRCALLLGENEKTLTRGGRLSFALLCQHADAIDEWFGTEITRRIDTKRTLRGGTDKAVEQWLREVGAR